MAIIPRQTGLLSAENWKKVYQTFREADFTAYDFETLRKTMIDYVKRNYPEDFNDFTESSEFVALIDLIAFFGQSLAFRADMNARENFIDTAERRDSILKLARLVSYNAKRNLPATGYLKIDSVTTTELVYDSDGNDLSTQVVNWADASNENWLEQFTAIVNACVVNTQSVGRPGNRSVINGVRTEEYGINITQNVIPVFRFTGAVDNQDMTFEIVSASSVGKNYVYEIAPDVGQLFNFLYMNDGLGNSSNGTGYFLYFKQGELKTVDFNIDEIVPNKTVNIDSNNINNNDVWLYSLDSSNRTDQLWTQVPAVSGVNVIYNTETDKTLYQVNSRVNDQISLVFGDGVFTTLPRGPFRLYYRTSNGLTYKITPDEMQGVEISLDYVSRFNRVETITFRASLRYTVANASARESADAIKQRAPQQYYTQNRMITGEDYNTLPYTNYSSILKVKSVNRTSSGLSRYLDMLDTTGKYSSTNVFGADGVLYKEQVEDAISFSFTNTYDIQSVIANQIEGQILRSKEILHQYYSTVVPKLLPAVSLPAEQMFPGEIYTIENIGTSDFVEYGASDNAINIQFVATNVGRQQYRHTVTIEQVENISKYNFTNSLTPYNPTIYLKEGDIITLNIAAPGQPLWIKTKAATGTDFAITDLGIITNNGTDNGTIIWDTTGVVDNQQKTRTFYYSSQYNAALSGTIVVSTYGTGTVKTNITWNLSSVGDSATTGYFAINRNPLRISDLSPYEHVGLLEPGAMVRFVAPENYHFNSVNSLVPGPAENPEDRTELYAAITILKGDGSNNGQGNFANGQGPITTNIKIPTGAIAHSVIPKFNNSLPDSLRTSMIQLIGNYATFGLRYVADTKSDRASATDPMVNYPNWQLVTSGLEYDPTVIITFKYDAGAKNFLVLTKVLKYVFHSEKETNFFYDESLQVYDSFNNSVIRDNIRVLKSNSRMNISKQVVSYGQDYVWEVHKPVRRTDGFIENKSIYVTFADTNDDSVPDIPFLFERMVEPKIWPNTKYVFFELVESYYDQYRTWRLLGKDEVITNYSKINDVVPVINNYDVGQLFFASSTNEFYQVQLNTSKQKVLGPSLNPMNSNIPSKYKYAVGVQDLYFQYRHNSPNTHRIDPNISNIVDIYVLTAAYNAAYRQYIQDATQRIVRPTAPTSTELQMDYAGLEKYKAISDTMIFHSAVFKPLFGSHADPALQAVFKVVKNPNLNTSDTDIKTSVITAINEYFSVENWDFGETFYFSELAAYLHKELSPKVASIVIVPRDPDVDFGALYQINAEANEIIISSATVNDVDIISSISVNQLNQSLANTNRSIGI